MVPVQHEPDPLELLPEARDVLRDQLGRMGVDLERVVLRVDPEGIESDGLEDIPPLQAPQPAVHVGPDEREDVTDVEPLGRRVGVHHEVEIGTLRPAQIGRVRASLLPGPTPLGLHRLRVVGVERGLLSGHSERNLKRLAPPGRLP